jgi:AGCS family alanine or glycine:cation symporter
MKGNVMVDSGLSHSIYAMIERLVDMIESWPLIIFVVGISILCTVMLGFVQFKYFKRSCSIALRPQAAAAGAGQISPLQAFLNSLSTGLGNGSLAGVATAIYAGGPGTVFWMVVIGLLLMAPRFAEVYLAVYKKTLRGLHFGGPIVYITDLFGNAVAWIYALSAFLFACIVSCALQSNAIALSLHQGWQVHPMFVAIGFLLFTMYVLFGGADRILRVSDLLTPLKVVLFFISASILLLYHAGNLVQALRLIVVSACTPQAIAGGALGFSVQQAMRFGIFRSIFASEAGLGTSSILFGATKSERPVEDGFMGMLSVFMSTVVCFLVGLCIVASGTWNSGLTSTELTSVAFQTAFGTFGNWIVTALSITFGMGVLVAYAFIARQVWLFISAGKHIWLFNLIYCVVAFGGALVNPHVLFHIGGIINACMLVINLSAVVLLLPVIRKALQEYAHK